MEKDPNRFWWLSLLLVAVCTVGLWLFQRSVFPALEAEATAQKTKVPHPYAAFMSLQSAMNYGRQDLIRGLVACAEADLALKLGGKELVLERLLWTLCGKAAPWESQMHVIRREQER